MCNKVEKMEEEVVVACNKFITCNLCGGTEKNHGNTQNSWSRD